MTLLDDLDPIFADCVGDSSTRHVLDKPWTHNGFAYATNGSIIVRQLTNRSASEPNAPDGAALFDGSEPSSVPILLPNIGPELTDTATCKDCHGRKPEGCRTCNNSGMCSCSKCGDEHECLDCNGKGKDECLECGGDGTIDRQGQSVKLADGIDVGLADNYVWLLQRHGINEVQIETHRKQSFCFRKGMVEGLVMGMTLPITDAT